MSKSNEKLDPVFKTVLTFRGITIGMYLFGVLFHLFEPKGLGEYLCMFCSFAMLDVTYILNGKRLYKKYKENAEPIILATNILIVTVAIIVSFIPAGLLSPLLAIIVASLPLLVSEVGNKVFDVGLSVSLTKLFEYFIQKVKDKKVD